MTTESVPEEATQPDGAQPPMSSESMPEETQLDETTPQPSAPPMTTGSVFDPTSELL